MAITDTEISMKNTKAEILEALQQALEKAERAEKGKLNPVKEEKVKLERKAIETAKKAVEQNIFSKELNDKFNDLQTAIASEENRLQELYGVGRELQKLALVLEAGKERLSEIEATGKTRLSEIESTKTEKEEEAKKSLDLLKAQFAQKNTELKEAHEESMKKLKVERTRENEEYQYALTRTRERENNEWADQKAARELELSKREEQTAELLSAAESKSQYIQTLEEKVDGIPTLVQSEKESAVAAAIEALQKEYGFKAALAEKDSQSTITRLKDKISFLEKELESTTKTASILQNKLDKAYTEIRELATKTVESASGVKIIGNTEGKG
ncbi:MAG: hypothetical protein FWG14_13935 [Peptococcaceae bacterium]|nr:hypothetical protein [Peptococcaceae bacterium]